MILGTRLDEGNVYNGIYEALRRKLVSLEHIPDRAIYTTATTYNAAVEAMRTAGKTIIEVRNVNSGEARDQMKINTFYINSMGHQNGEYGGGKSTIIVSNDDTNEDIRYSRLLQPSKPQDLNVEISYKSNNGDLIILMSRIRQIVFGERTFIASYSDDATAGGTFLIHANGEINMDSGLKLDRRARYTVKDLILYEPQVLQETVMPMITITPVIGSSEVVNEFPD